MSVEVENPLMNTPGDLISLNISLNKAGNRKRGRPKRPATATSETSETSDSPEKKKKRGDKARDKASDKKKIENVKKSVDIGSIEPRG